MNGIFRTIAAALTVAALHGATPTLKLDREINLNAMIQERDGLRPSTHSVVSLAFSPDEKWIAVGVGLHYKSGTSQPMEFDSHVIVAALKEGTGRSLQIDPDTGVAQGSLVWAPDSNLLAVDGQQGFKCYAIPGGAVEGLATGHTAVAAPRLYRPRHGLAYASIESRLRAKEAGAPLAVYTFDLTGQVTDVWDAPSRSAVVAVDPDRHLIAVAMDSGEPDTVYPILSYPGRAALQDWSNVKPFGMPILAESGKTVCGGAYLARDSRHASCWDIDTGKKIAEFKGFPAGWPASVSSHGSRMVLTHGRMVRGVTEEDDMRANQNRVVWDFRADRVVAQWVPVTQATETGMRPPADKRTEFGPSIISPSGRYIAEGTNGLLRIYELP